jgi:predicted AAA+ superfamily ATPase
MDIYREISATLRDLAPATPAIVLTGARQTGKTTALRMAFPEHGYVTLDLPSLAERAERDPEGFLGDHPTPLIVDEVQYAPGLFRHVKAAIDRDRRGYGRFALTGSQKFTLMRDVSSLRDFERFIRACAHRNGQMLDRSSLARDVGITGKTADAWLGVLVASNQVFLLEPWFANVGKRLVKSPKLYFADPGLCAWLLGVTRATLNGSPYVGALWEAAVYAEIRKTNAYRRLPATVWYYRDDRQLEVDFLLTAGGRGLALEAKSTEHPDARDARGLRTFLTHAASRAVAELALEARGVVVARPAGPFPIGGDGPPVEAIDLERLPPMLRAFFDAGEAVVGADDRA